MALMITMVFNIIANDASLSWLLAVLWGILHTEITLGAV